MATFNRTIILAVFLIGGRTPVFASAGPNIVLIVIDTLRPDHLASYGYTRKTAPFIDSLAAKGTVYTRAYAPSSWTIPSVASLFTGYYPFNHGVIHSISSSEKMVAYEALPEQAVTLAERFKKAGYTTIGISANGLLSERYGFSRGFDYFSCAYHVPADKTNELFEKTISRIKGKATPFFLWVHYFDPHYPYRLRKPWIYHYFSLSKFLGINLITDEIRNEPQNLDLVIAGYDSEINYVDKHVKRLLKNIPTGNTIVVITSDHGEEFREHGAWDHGTNLYNESIRIPLIISRPDRPHKIIPQPVSLLDLYPALLSRAGIPLPEKLDAQALPPREKRAVYSELAKRHRYGFISDPQKTIIKDRYKLHRNLSSGREELYDIVSDPGETQDISLKKPKIKNEMHILMDKLVSKEKRFKARLKYTETDKKTIKLLRSLGYIQ